ncbi:MAG TPA: hypothetical protein VKR06_21025 [Ktedonosporobacter sp.]|nr:hypothetical protein [Ktedonosporobacter sp.]
MSKNVVSALLAALIALPMYYMFWSMFHWGFETTQFLTALGIGVATFVITLVVYMLVSRQRQKAV